MRLGACLQYAFLGTFAGKPLNETAASSYVDSLVDTLAPPEMRDEGQQYRHAADRPAPRPTQRPYGPEHKPTDQPDIDNCRYKYPRPDSTEIGLYVDDRDPLFLGKIGLLDKPGQVAWIAREQNYRTLQFQRGRRHHRVDGVAMPGEAGGAKELTRSPADFRCHRLYGDSGQDTMYGCVASTATECFGQGDRADYDPGGKRKPRPAELSNPIRQEPSTQYWFNRVTASSLAMSMTAFSASPTRLTRR